MYEERQINLKTFHQLNPYLSLVFLGGNQQSLALNIIITTTCHFSHYNTVRAVPVTVWEDGWEEMCLYCNLAQRVCSLTQTRNFLWNAVKPFFLSSFFFFFFSPTPTHISLCLSLSLPPSIPPISLPLWHAFVTSDRRGRPDRYSDNMVSDPLLNASSSRSSISLGASILRLAYWVGPSTRQYAVISIVL